MLFSTVWLHHRNVVPEPAFISGEAPLQVSMTALDRRARKG